MDGTAPKAHSGKAHRILLRDEVIDLCDRLGEATDSRSEPDVIAKFGMYGLVFIEVKYLSGNAWQVFDVKHEKYLNETDAFKTPSGWSTSGP